MTEFDNGLKANMFSNIDSKDTSGSFKIDIHLPILTKNSERIVSVGTELSIFVNLMVLDPHKINRQLSDFPFLSLTNIRPFWIDTLNEIKIVVRR